MTRERSSSSPPARGDFTESTTAREKGRGRPRARGTAPPRESQTFLRVGCADDADDTASLDSARDGLEDAEWTGKTAAFSRAERANAFFDAETRNADGVGPMTQVMSPKKLPTKRSNGSDPTDPRLVTGEVIIVDGDPTARMALKAGIARVLGPEVKALADMEALKHYIHPRSTARAGRPPVRGFLLDWELGKPRGAPLLELLKWLDDVYPRTPVVTYTGAPDLSEIRRMCAVRQHEIWPLKRTAADEPLRHAALAVVHLPPEKMAVFARDRLTDAVLRLIEQAWFKRWEERRLAARVWLLDQLRVRNEATELHMRTIEAYFETVRYDDLCDARGVVPVTITQQAKEVGRIWGESIDSLKQRWDRVHEGRGTGTPAFVTDAMRGADDATIDDAKPPRPPGPRRPSARRSP